MTTSATTYASGGFLHVPSVAVLIQFARETPAFPHRDYLRVAAGEAERVTRERDQLPVSFP